MVFSVLCGLILSIAGPDTSIAMAPVRDLSPQELVAQYAQEKGVPIKLADYIAEHESHYNPSEVGDMNITCKRTGLPVYARGIFQITRCYYPDISDKDAFDPETNIKIGLDIIAQGEKVCRNQFSTCNDYYKTHH